MVVQVEPLTMADARRECIEIAVAVEVGERHAAADG